MQISNLSECDLIALQDCYAEFLITHWDEGITFEDFITEIIENTKEDE